MFSLLKQWKEIKNNSLYKQNHFFDVFVESNKEARILLKNLIKIT